MAQADSGFAYRDHRRRRLDRITRRIVVGSGLLVMMALMLIFFYLLTVVMPLFRSPTVTPQHAIPRAQDAPSLVVGISDDAALGYRIDKAGVGEIVALTRGDTVARVALTPSSVTQVATLSAVSPRYALVLATGKIVVVSPTLSVSDNAAPGWYFPFGAQGIALTADVQPLRSVAFAAGPETPRIAGDLTTENPPAQAVAAAVTQDNRLVVSALTATEAGGAAVREIAQQTLGEAQIDDLVLAPDGNRIYTLSGTQLTAWRVLAGVITRQDRVTLPAPGPWRLALLSGGHSVLVYTAVGDIVQWFDVPSAQGMQLKAIRDFPQMQTQGMQLVTEAQRRVFATLTPQGDFSLFASKQSSALLTLPIAAHAQQWAFSPHGRALLVETADRWHAYHIDNPYPDIGWRGLWQKIWYENYPEPDYVWQSTAADDSYQAKFSLVPLLTGSVKAALYAMMFAMPLGLAAAIYTACFMTPGLRRWVKPTLEIMGALPTVVVGLIAALWLAPHVETHLSAILALPFLCALTIIAVGMAIDRCSLFWSWLQGREVVILIPLLLLTLGVCFRLGPWVDGLLLGQPLYQWLDGRFVQRNALVVGIALGFALIPVMFSLAEDALFSVPFRLRQGSLALGATAWQTVWHVVLPSASAGIFAAMMLSFGRAIGETMIVLMATGNTPIMDAGLFQGLRALAANIAIEMPEAVTGSGHYRVLFLTALVLFLFTFVINTLAELIRQRLRQRYGEEGDHA